MYLFNEAISALGLVELPLKGRRFTWTNKQFQPLLERLDWFFTSTNWTISYPNTFAHSLVNETSDHAPCVVTISTSIPSSKIFRFENFWLEHQDFMNIVQQNWVAPQHISDPAKILTAKFKNMRRALKEWHIGLSNLKILIGNVKLILYFLLFIEEFRDLCLPEWNFKVLLEQKLISLLHQQHVYWKQRGPIKWVTLGDASTKFFDAHATVKYRRNLITSLQVSPDHYVSTHEEKAQHIWTSFKERLGISNFTGINFDLPVLLEGVDDLSSLVSPFAKEEIDNVIRNLPSDKAPGPDGFNTDFFKKC
jgi:hypothetical protein